MFFHHRSYPVDHTRDFNAENNLWPNDHMFEPQPMLHGQWNVFVVLLVQHALWFVEHVVRTAHEQNTSLLGIRLRNMDWMYVCELLR